MKCHEIKENLIFFVEGSLNPEKTNQVQKHLEECNECQAYYLYIKSLLTIIEKEKIKDHNPYFSMKVMERLKNHSGSKEVFKAFHVVSILKPVFAVLLIGIAIFTGILLGDIYTQKRDTLNIDDSRASQLQAIADEFYLYDLGVENIETILITENKK
jgi:predicted anti-sigma-YlaC factor YlaD